MVTPANWVMMRDLRKLLRMFREHGLRAPKIYPEPLQFSFELAYQFAVVMGIGIVLVVPPGLVFLGLAAWNACTRW